MVVDIDKIDVWHDPRTQKLSANVNGHVYGYWDSAAEGTEKGVIFLVHGFPDLGAGWRYQIPMFIKLGFRVIAIDCIGYGRSDAPDTSLEEYTFKSTANDIVTMAKQMGYDRIILGGHDWGGAIVQRTAQYHPLIVSHIFTVCTPYFPIAQTYTPINLMIKAAPTYTYMLQFQKGCIEPLIRSKREIREFLNAIYGFPTGPNGEKGFSPSTGFIVENFSKLSASPLFSETELDFYVQEYSRHGVNGPFNWYRMRELNYVNDYETFIAPATNGSETLRQDPGIEQETLHVLALDDEVFPRHVCEMTQTGFKKLTQAAVHADHWILWSKPKEINAILEAWMREKVLAQVT